MLALLPTELDALAGIELGGVPLATVLSQKTGLPALFVRKQAKTYGTRQLTEGGDVTGRRLAIVEDVVTSGGQILASCQQLRELGARVDVALCVIDRQAGGTASLAAKSIELRSLFTSDQLNAAAASL